MTDERKGLPSASGAFRWVNCPGSVALENAVVSEQPEQVEHTEDAKSGTRIHDALALAGPGALILTEDEQKSVDYLNTRAEFLAINNGFDAFNFLSERRLWLSIEGKEVMSGKFDRAYVSPEGRVLILDFKRGRDEVESAPINEQLRKLAVLWWVNFGSINNPKEVIVAIVPHYDRVTLCRYDRSDLELALSETTYQLTKIISGDSTRTPGEWCKWCKAKAICPEVQQEVKGLTVVPPARLPEMSGETVASLLDFCDQAEDVIDAVRKEAKRRLSESPGAVPGWFMKPGNEVRGITPENMVPVYFALRDAIPSIDTTKFMAACKVSIGALFDLFKAESGLKVDEAEEWFNEIIAPVVSKSQNAPSLKKARKTSK